MTGRPKRTRPLKANKVLDLRRKVENVEFSERAVIHSFASCRVEKQTLLYCCRCYCCNIYGNSFLQLTTKLMLNKEFAHLYLSAKFIMSLSEADKVTKGNTNLFTRLKVTILSKKSRQKFFQLSFRKLILKMHTV